MTSITIGATLIWTLHVIGSVFPVYGFIMESLWKGYASYVLKTYYINIIVTIQGRKYINILSTSGWTTGKLIIIIFSIIRP